MAENTTLQLPEGWAAVVNGTYSRPVWDLFPVSSMTAGGWLVPHAFQEDKWVPVRRVSKERYWAEAQSRADILMAHDLAVLMQDDDWEAYCEDDVWGTARTMEDAVLDLTSERETVVIRRAR